MDYTCSKCKKEIFGRCTTTREGHVCRTCSIQSKKEAPVVSYDVEIFSPKDVVLVPHNKRTLKAVVIKQLGSRVQVKATLLSGEEKVLHITTDRIRRATEKDL